MVPCISMLLNHCCIMEALECIYCESYHVMMEVQVAICVSLFEILMPYITSCSYFHDQLVLFFELTWVLIQQLLKLTYLKFAWSCILLSRVAWDGEHFQLGDKTFSSVQELGKCFEQIGFFEKNGTLHTVSSYPLMYRLYFQLFYSCHFMLLSCN